MSSPQKGLLRTPAQESIRGAWLSGLVSFSGPPPACLSVRPAKSVISPGMTSVNSLPQKSTCLCSFQSPFTGAQQNEHGIRRGSEESGCSENRVNREVKRGSQARGPPAQGPQAPSGPFGSGVLGEKGRKEEESKFSGARERGPTLPGSKGLFRQEGGVK